MKKIPSSSGRVYWELTKHERHTLKTSHAGRQRETPRTQKITRRRNSQTKTFCCIIGPGQQPAHTHTHICRQLGSNRDSWSMSPFSTGSVKDSNSFLVSNSLSLSRIFWPFELVRSTGNPMCGPSLIYKQGSVQVFLQIIDNQATAWIPNQKTKTLMMWKTI